MSDVRAIAVDPRRTGLRIWQRRVDVGSGPVCRIPLRFRVVPALWPNIEVAEPDRTPADVSAAVHELVVACEPAEGGGLDIELRGLTVALSGRTLRTSVGDLELAGTGALTLTIIVDDTCAAVLVDGCAPIVIALDPPVADVAASPVTDNVTGFRIAAPPASAGTMTVREPARLTAATLYGLRSAQTAMYRAADAVTDPGPTFFAAADYVVADRGVVDGHDTPALVPDRRTIVSPIRVVEEFEWRDTPYGDMTRVVDRSEIWHAALEPGRFPDLASGYRSVDAAFALALETFQRNASGEFSLPGQSGLWSAGYFQGPGQGFGSWKRDTAHIALRAGSLIDPAVARASLAHVVNAGFDNGSDGESLPAAAVWDHVLASGDESLVHETWPRLAAAGEALDAAFDDDRGLIRAAQSTSNDLFDEPEAGGYALSTEIYAMASYAALADMGSLPGVADARADAWRRRAAAMRDAIQTQYWNDERGFFTSGPVGSESHARGLWETSGSEAAAWGFLGDGADERIARSLVAGRREALSDYGFVLFPYRTDDNHFCGSVWYCWHAGLARAAARLGDADLVHRLIGQQTRTVVLNKSFYEVTDARDGHSWRWPGQLWHAAGFVSTVLFGLFGIRYDAQGMAFSPAVPRQLDGARISGLRFRSAILDIETRGHGTRCRMTVDGRPATRVGVDAVGRLSIVLEMTP